MRKIYNKLVRDRIPEIIQQNSGRCEIATYTASEFRHALKEKLVEEAQEIVQTDENSLLEELADLYEVIDALMELYEIDIEEIKAVQSRKRDNRGGFRDRVKLCWTE